MYYYYLYNIKHKIQLHNDTNCNRNNNSLIESKITLIDFNLEEKEIKLSDYIIQSTDATSTTNKLTNTISANNKCN